MSGEGTGKGRHLLRRAAISVTTACLVVLIGSRINPINQPAATAPTASDEVLSQVDVNDESFGAAIDSIRRTCRSKIILNDQELERVGLETYYVPADDRSTKNHLRLTNVRLGTVLSVVLKAFGRRPIECRVNRDTITIGAAPEILRRVYDVRDIVAECDRYWGPPPSQPSAGTRGSDPPSVEERVGEDLTFSLRALDIEWDGRNVLWHASSWGGWLIIDSTPSGHRQIEQFLELLRRGESADFRLKGATP